MRTGTGVRLLGMIAFAVLALGSVAAAYELGQRDGGDVALPEAFADLQQVYDLVRQDAVEVPPDEELAEAAVEGLLGALDDQYAEYYDPEEYGQVNEQLEGRFVGIGVVLDVTEDEELVVLSVLPGSPAEESGVRIGARIVSVDGEDITDLPSDVVISRITGEEGTDVTVGFLAPPDDADAGEVVERTITRAELEIPTVQARLLDDTAAGMPVGYLQLFQFTPDAGEELGDELSRLLDEGAEAIVLDLRNNPGGLLDAAVDVTGLFVPEGTEVVSSGESFETARTLSTDTAPLAPPGEVPLTVLVNEASASASEVVAGALQDLDRAPLIGETTFGKGTVQTIRPLPDGAGVKFTTSRYFTPEGRSIDDAGLEPELVVELPDDVALGAPEDPVLDAAVDALADGESDVAGQAG